MVFCAAVVLLLGAASAELCTDDEKTAAGFDACLVTPSALCPPPLLPSFQPSSAQASCDASCEADIGAMTCEIELGIDSTSRGQFGAELVPALTAYQDTCAKDKLCEDLLDRFVTSADACCGATSASAGSCPDGFPRQCDNKCAPNIMLFYGACAQDVYNATHPQGPALSDVEKQCYSALVEQTAKDSYSDMAGSFDMPICFWVLAAVPFFFFMFLALFGRQVATLFREPQPRSRDSCATVAEWRGCGAQAW